MKLNITRHLLLASLAILIITGCGIVKATEDKTHTSDACCPGTIYVADFDLQAEKKHNERRWRWVRIDSLDPFRRMMLVRTDDPNERAVKLVSLMSDSIVNDLTKAGYRATRLVPGQQMPSHGWLIRGVFTEIQEGNRLRKAMVGPGSTNTDLQVVICIDKLSGGHPKPMYEVQMDATNGSAPGAGALILVDATAPVVRYVLAGNDLKKDAQGTAKKIAARLDQQIARDTKAPRETGITWSVRALVSVN